MERTAAGWRSGDPNDLPLGGERPAIRCHRRRGAWAFTDIGDSVVAFALPESGAGLLAQSMAPTLRTVGVLLVLLLAALLVIRLAQELVLVSAAGHPDHHRDLGGLDCQPVHPYERAYHVLGGSYRLAIDPRTQSPLSASANIELWSRMSIIMTIRVSQRPNNTLETVEGHVSVSARFVWGLSRDCTTTELEVDPLR